MASVDVRAMAKAMKDVGVSEDKILEATRRMRGAGSVKLNRAVVGRLKDMLVAEGKAVVTAGAKRIKVWSMSAYEANTAHLKGAKSGARKEAKKDG